MKRTLLSIALLCVLAPAINAQTIYKCTVGKQTTYQTDPCPPSAKTKTAKTYAPINDDPSAAARLRRIEADVAANRAAATSTMVYSSYGGDAGIDARSQQRQRCATAKAQRAQRLEEVGLRRTYNLLQQLDAFVNQACAGL